MSENDPRPVSENAYDAYEALLAACAFYQRNGREKEARECFAIAMNIRWQIIFREMQWIYEAVTHGS